MITETFLPEEIEAKTAEGWTLVKTNTFGGKVRSVVMQKEGDPAAWVDEHAPNYETSRSMMSTRSRKMFDNRDRLRRRGIDC